MSFLPDAPSKRDGADYCYSCPSCMSPHGLHWNPAKGLGVCWSCKVGFNNASMKKAFKAGASLPELPQVERTGWRLTSKQFDPWSESTICREILKADYDYDGDKGGWGIPLKQMLNQIQQPVFDPVTNRIGFPVHGQKTTLYNWRSIFREKRGWRLDRGIDRETAHYSCSLQHNHPYPVVLVEGILDALRVESAGWDATSTLGTSPGHSLPEMLRREGRTNIIAWMDPDKAGALGEEKIKQWFSPAFFKVSVIHFHKEPAECRSAEIETVIQECLLATK